MEGGRLTRFIHGQLVGVEAREAWDNGIVLYHTIYSATKGGR